MSVRSEAKFPTSFPPETQKLPPKTKWYGYVTFDGRVRNLIPASISYIDGKQTLTQTFEGRHHVVPAGRAMAGAGGERLELYKLSVEMADRLSARRGTANAFFLTLETVLAGFAGVVRPSGSGVHGALRVDAFGIVLASVVGLVLSATWWLLLRSYRDLNEAKFKVILAMEKDLEVQPFGDEWNHLKGDPIKSFAARYAELGVVERVVPFAFVFVYIVIGGRAIFS